MVHSAFAPCGKDWNPVGEIRQSVAGLNAATEAIVFAMRRLSFFAPRSCRPVAKAHEAETDLVTRHWVTLMSWQPRDALEGRQMRRDALIRRESERLGWGSGEEMNVPDG